MWLLKGSGVHPTPSPTPTPTPTPPPLAVRAISAESEDGAGSLTLNAPAVGDRVAGDLWVAVVYEATTGGSGGGLTGWTEWVHDHGSGGAISVWSFLYSGTLPSLVCARESPGGNGAMIGVILAIQGQNATPLNVVNTVNTGSGTSMTFDSAIVSAANTLIILVDGSLAASSRVSPMTVGITPILEDSTAGTQQGLISTLGSGDASLGIYTKTQIPTGSTGGFTVTQSISASWVTRLFVIQP